jgi:hypothetical protein
MKILRKRQVRFLYRFLTRSPIPAYFRLEIFSKVKIVIFEV